MNQILFILKGGLDESSPYKFKSNLYSNFSLFPVFGLFQFIKERV